MAVLPQRLRAGKLIDISEQLIAALQLFSNHYRQSREGGSLLLARCVCVCVCVCVDLHYHLLFSIVLTDSPGGDKGTLADRTFRLVVSWMGSRAHSCAIKHTPCYPPPPPRALVQ